jgi:hypothetical protein
MFGLPIQGFYLSVIVLTPLGIVALFWLLRHFLPTNITTVIGKGLYWICVALAGWAMVSSVARTLSMGIFGAVYLIPAAVVTVLLLALANVAWQFLVRRAREPAVDAA